MRTDDTSIAVGRFLAQKRAEHGMSQAGVARSMGLLQATVSNIELGTRSLKFTDAVRLSQTIGFDLAELAAIVPSLDELCPVCGGNPKRGFTCNRCGASSGVERS